MKLIKTMGLKLLKSPYQNEWYTIECEYYLQFNFINLSADVRCKTIMYKLLNK